MALLTSTMRSVPRVPGTVPGTLGVCRSRPLKGSAARGTPARPNGRGNRAPFTSAREGAQVATTVQTTPTPPFTSPTAGVAS